MRCAKPGWGRWLAGEQRELWHEVELEGQRKRGRAGNRQHMLEAIGCLAAVAKPGKTIERLASPGLTKHIEKSKQKYMDIVRRLQNETFQSGIGYEMENSVHDEDDTIDSKSTEAESEQPEGEEGEEEEFLTISYNPRLKPTRGCMIKYRKGWPHRPLSPSEVCACAPTKRER